MTAGVFGEITLNGDVALVVTGDDWEINAAAGALRRITPLISRRQDVRGAVFVPLTWAAVTQIAHTFSGNHLGQWMPGPKLSAWVLEEFTKRAATVYVTASGLEFPAEPAQLPAAKPEIAIAEEPAAVEAQPATGPEPRQYQLEGARMIANAGRFLLFDDPGTGKTATSILGLRQRQDVFPLVIVVPSWDVADAWAREIRTWAPEWPEPGMYGGGDRLRLLAASGDKTASPREPAATRPVTADDGRILITTYATARIDAKDMTGPLAKFRAAAVVCDEIHMCKNSQAKQSAAVKRIAAHAGTFLGLSGTPVTRDTGDFYSVLEAMSPLDWPSEKRFRDRYLQVTEEEYSERVEGLDHLAEPEFRAVLLGQMLRRSKADVLPQLPPKVYSVRRVELPPEWRRAYDSLERDMLAELPDGEELPVMSVLAQLTRLSQLASSAFDVRTGEPQEDGTFRYEVTLKAPSWKADALLEILAERRGHPVAAFTASRQLAEICGAACEEAGLRVCYITGTVSKKARNQAIEDFQGGRKDVILLTAGAGGLGITLTAAGTVVMLQRSWEFDKAVQPEDRAHRIGQQHDSVEIIDVVAKGTVDERVRELTRIKGRHLGELVRDPAIVRELFGGLR